MASEKKAREENVEGSFFVDSTCIDCGTCYWMAPKVFKRNGSQSAVYAQPIETDVDTATAALSACPTASIGTRDHKARVPAVVASFPRRISKGVHHCGFHSEKSFGAASYYVESEGKSFMVDSPRFNAKLVAALREKSSPSHLYLTHIDDVADHARFQKEFSLSRSIHRDDLNAELQAVEQIFEGSASFETEEHLQVIPVPGHTKGSVCYLYRNEFLFTGDHLAWDQEKQRLKAFATACWYSWDEQICSMRKLLDFDFEWVLPGHGAPVHLERSQMKSALKDCISWMESVSFPKK